MASKVDICNLGLANIGHRANVASISPPEATVEAQGCARFYPIARDETLESHDWGFAMTRQALVELADAAPASWTYAYQVPNGCMRVVALLNEDATSDAPTEKWIREGDRIYTNVPNATMRYVQRIDDPTKYSAKFVVSLAHRIGAYMAGVIIKGKAGEDVRDKQLRLAEAVLTQAEGHDSNSERTNTYRDFKGGAVNARN